MVDEMSVKLDYETRNMIFVGIHDASSASLRMGNYIIKEQNAWVAATLPTTVTDQHAATAYGVELPPCEVEGCE